VDRIEVNATTGEVTVIPLTPEEIAAHDAMVVAAEQAAQAAAMEEGNEATIRQQAANALATNRTFLALSSPTNAQTLAEVKALARQMNGVVRLLINQFDGTD
jgi:hypothetical protein